MFKQIKQTLINTIEKPVIRRLRQIDLVRFSLVGAIGFLVNFVGLVIFHAYLKLDIIYSQLLAAEIAMLTSFLLHTHWTYKSYRQEPIWRRLIKFHASSGIGFLVNSITVIFLVKSLALYYGFALAVGSLVALFFNFGMTRYFVWAKEK